MPLYDFYHARCGNSDTTYYTMDSVPGTMKCSRCGGRAKRCISSGVSGFVRGGTMGAKTRQQFRHVFSKKRWQKMETTRDVDRGFDDFHRRYPYLTRPGPSVRDPLPTVGVRDKYDKNKGY